MNQKSEFEQFTDAKQILSKDKASNKIERLEAEIKPLRDMLFDLCRVLESQGRLDSIPKTQRAWYARWRLLRHAEASCSPSG